MRYGEKRDVQAERVRAGELPELTPEQVKKIPYVAEDRNGNPLIEWHGIYWSKYFERFWQLLTEKRGNAVMVCTLGHSVKFVQMWQNTNRRYWYDWLMGEGRFFFDPDTQFILPLQMRQRADKVKPYYAKKSVSQG